MENKIYLNSNEKVARAVTGLETEAKHFVLNGETADKTLAREAASKFNDRVDDYIENLNEHTERIKSYVDNFKEKLNNFEIKAINNNFIAKPFAENPFQRITVSKSGIITDLGGQAPVYKSNETGEFEEEESAIMVAEVVDAGPECKYIKDGDVVFFTKASQVPVPFFRQGLVYANENRIMAVVNEGLTARFSNLK